MVNWSSIQAATRVRFPAARSGAAEHAVDELAEVPGDPSQPPASAGPKWSWPQVRKRSRDQSLLSRELPANRPGLAATLSLDGEDACSKLLQAVRDGRRQHLALRDPEENLHLIQPTGLGGSVDQDQVGVVLPKTASGLLARWEEPLSRSRRRMAPIGKAPWP